MKTRLLKRRRKLSIRFRIKFAAERNFMLKERMPFGGASSMASTHITQSMVISRCVGDEAYNLRGFDSATAAVFG